MKVLVCGGRNYSDKVFVYQTLSQYKISLIVHGAASGADNLADQYANDHGIEKLVFPADWDHYGAGAGPIRNQQMIETKPDLVIAFPGGKGTQDMIKRGIKYNIAVIEFFEFEGQTQYAFHERKEI